MEHKSFRARNSVKDHDFYRKMGPAHPAPHPTTQNTPKICPILGENRVKIAQNRDISAVVARMLAKHPKLQLPQRVEHVSTPWKRKIRRISASKRNFTPKSTLRRGKMGVLRGHQGSKNGQKWSKTRFFKNYPKSVSDTGQSILGPLGGQIGPHGDPYTPPKNAQTRQNIPTNDRKCGQNRPKIAISRPL